MQLEATYSLFNPTWPFVRVETLGHDSMIVRDDQGGICGLTVEIDGEKYTIPLLPRE